VNAIVPTSSVTLQAGVEQFTFGGHPIRIAYIASDPRFVATDVCTALKLQNASMTLKALDADEVSKFNLGGRTGEVLVISEGGLFSLIMRCRYATTKGSTAHTFRRWVTHTVLPEIRRTGSYAAPAPTPVPVPDDLDDNRTLRRLLLARLEREEALADQLAMTDQELIDTSRQLTVTQRHLQRAQPAVEFVERFAESEELYSLQAGGKALGQKPNKFVAWLKQRGDLLDLNRSNLPRQDLIDRALFRVRIEEYGGKPRATPKLTSKGILHYGRELCVSVDWKAAREPDLFD